jgi:hypothetical protein
VNTWHVFIGALTLLFSLDLLAVLPWFRVGFGRRRGALGWALSLLLWVFGGWSGKLAGSLFLWAFFRQHFIERRWTTVRRGFGAPGFMSHWTLLYLVILQFSACLDASGALTEQVWLTMKIDFATIMVCAGTYKYMVGFCHGDGMEYGRVNPLWGYFWKYYKDHDPRGLHVRITNVLASLVEVVAGLMMYASGWVQWLGAVSISISFIFVALFIRLGRLAWLMALLPLIYAPQFGADLHRSIPFHLDTPSWCLQGLHALSWLFIALLPLVKVTQYTNLFANRQLPQPLQGWVTAYSNRIPIIIWRVFTPDVINFYLRIYSADGQRVVDESSYRLSQLWKNWRFFHVAESIAMVSVFTTLKYFPSKPELFNSRLLEYAASLPGGHRQLRFEYVAISKGETEFFYTHVGNFWVDLDQGSVQRELLLEGFDFSAPSHHSPVRESEKPGSYVPKSANSNR